MLAVHRMFDGIVFYMMKFLHIFFTVLGVIFFIILCGLMYVWFADPFNIRPLIDSLTSDVPVSVSEDAGSGTVVDKNPALSDEQEKALESVGINPENLPSSITPEMEACFTAKLGTARVEEIKAGSTPTAVEVFSTRACYE